MKNGELEEKGRSPAPKQNKRKSPSTVKRRRGWGRRKIVVLLAIGDGSVRKRWINALRGQCLVAAVADGEALKHSIIRLKPSILVLQLDLPKFEGMAGISRLRDLAPQTKTILLAKAVDQTEAVRAFKSGAKGYLHVEIDPPLIRKSINAVDRGEIWLGRALIAQVLDELRAEALPKMLNDLRAMSSRITQRQREIIQMIGRGSSNKEIGSKLGITERTVKAHLTAIYQKLHLGGRLPLGLLFANFLPESQKNINRRGERQ
jgi:DNA-binding NarL/FixJ family response regulator